MISVILYITKYHCYIAAIRLMFIHVLFTTVSCSVMYINCMIVKCLKNVEF